MLDELDEPDGEAVLWLLLPVLPCALLLLVVLPWLPELTLPLWPLVPL